MSSPLQGGGRRGLLRGVRPALGAPPRSGLLRRALLAALLVIVALAVSMAFAAVETADVGGDASPGPAAAKRSDGSGDRSGGGPGREPEPVPSLDLDEPDSLSIRKLEKTPRAGVLFDLESGEVLWRRDPERRLPVASLTKIMTALIVVDRRKPGDRVRITREAIDFSGSAVGLPKGKRVRVDSLMHAMLIQSGNDAATALAVDIAGSERRFAKLMNARARRLGLTCTHFVSSDGLEPRNRSCAADLGTLTRLAMDEPRITDIVRKERAAVRAPISGGRLHLATTNPLLKTDYPGAVGLKTGFTEQAGACLAGVVRRGGRELGVVLIDSPDPNRNARALFGRALGETRRD